MKTIEEKAKAYDKALKQIKECIPDENGFITIYPQEIFPELKESEDDRIRRVLREIVLQWKNGHQAWCSDDKEIDAILAWLEKQVEQKPKFRVGDTIKNKKTNEIFTISDYSQLYEYYHDINHFHEIKFSEQDDWELVEQKPTDKVEPKFKAGDWVMLNRPVLITKVEDMPYNTHQYWTSDGTWFGDATKSKLWTVQDAKDGDVLATLDYILIFKEHLKDDGGVSYCHYDFGAGNPQFIWCEDKNWYFGKEAIVHPATKEQRDTLFAKMKEAGYEWDAEKKELKKIENEIEIPFGAKDSELQEATYYIPKGFHAEIEGNNVVIKKGKQRPAWSEEDEEIVETLNEYVKNLDILFSEIKIGDKDILSKEFREKVQLWLKSFKDRVQPQTKQEWSEEDERVRQDIENLIHFALEDGSAVSPAAHTTKEKAISWIQFLKERYTWKPSDEQMQALSDAGNSFRPFEEGHKVLWSLYNDLKKLREE